MATLHLIGIGGTGHKLVSACVHLAACGAFKGRLGSSEINSIRIASIDADDGNGNLSETRRLVSAYGKFYEVLSPVTKLNLVEIQPLTNIRLYQDDKKSINEAFNIPQYKDSDTEILANFLYTKDEINAEFDQGFYGHTSIGTLIVKDILKNDTKWQDFLGKISDNDFVFLFGSIFGGTGASAIPVVLEELKKMKKDSQHGMKYAALLLTPYFNTVGSIREAGKLQPDSSTFQLKAKASLYYYAAQRQYDNADSLYVIGEPQENFSNEEASRGSSDQKNKPHAVELFAASAVIDFIKEADERTDRKIITAERETANGEYYYTWKMVQKIDAALPQKIQRMIKTAVFYNKILYGQISGKTKSPSDAFEKFYAADLRAEKDDNGNFLCDNVREYTRRLVDWFYDIHKKNLSEENQNTGRLKWLPDKRVKLLDIEDKSLFDNAPVSGSASLPNFADLIYNDELPRKSEKIYAEFDRKPQKNEGKKLPALFSVLLDLLDKPLGFLEKKPSFKPETYAFVPYLSKENNTTFKRAEAGPESLWAKSEVGILTDIANGLPYIVSESFSADSISIPSPWSIFITNELVLTEEKFKSLNQNAYNTWCGLLALLALRTLRAYESDGLEMRALNAGNGEFVTLVSETCVPYSYVFDNPVWSRFYAVSLDGTIIAFLSHGAIVCPAYSVPFAARQKLHSMAPSLVNEKGDFQSPVNYFADTSQSVAREAKYALSLFLKELKKILTECAAANKRPIIKALQDLTDRFISDLGKVTQSSEIQISAAGQNQITDMYSLFELLRVKSSAKIELPFRLSGGAKKAAVLIGTNICGISSASAQAASLFVTEKIKYSQINAAAIGEFAGVRDGYLLLDESSLLLDTMGAVKKDASQVFHSLDNTHLRLIGDCEIIWPLNKTLLDLYDAKTLNEMLSVSEEADSYTITLELPLERGKHLVTKKYKKAADNSEKFSGTPLCYVFDRDYMPLWAVWPYAEILDQAGVNTWKRYNFFCVERELRSGSVKVLEIEPVFAAGGVSENLLGQQELSAITDSSPSPVKRGVYYRRYRTLPCALKLSIKTEAGKPSALAGFVFLKEPLRRAASGVEWNVGLDFGTTSTTAFYSAKGDGEPRFVQLLSEYGWREGDNNPAQVSEVQSAVQILSNSGTDQSDLEHYFIDKQCLAQNGYITTYEVLDAANQSTANTIFESGRIFWHNWDNFRILNTKAGRRDNLKTNIKWDGNRSFVGKYLNQLLTQIVFKAAANHVRRINWFFSYPTAFGPSDQGEFGNTLSDLMKGLSSDSGVECVYGTTGHLLTESIAAACYFHNKNKNQQLFCCADIGGGTSDISIWVKDNNLFQTSVRFASRDMFVKPLSKLLLRKSVMDAVCTTKADDGIYNMLNYVGSGSVNSPDKIRFFIETVLFEYYDTFKHRLNLLEGEDKQCYLNFKYCVFIAYTALCYYLGSITASLFRNGSIDNDITEVVLGLSGKGAKLTDWIDTLCPIVYSEVEKLIGQAKGGDSTMRVKSQFEPGAAKTETAKGLICNLDGSGRQQSASTSAEAQVFLGCGVDLTKDGLTKSYGKDQFAASYTDPYIKTPELLSADFDKELADFGDFLNFFNRVAAKTRGDMKEIDLDWYAKHKKNIWNQIKAAFANTLSEEKRFEPPFILQIKVFLDYYSEEYLYAR